MVIGEPSLDPHAVTEEISALKLVHTSANLDATLRQVETLLEHAREQGLSHAGSQEPKRPRKNQGADCFDQRNG